MTAYPLHQSARQLSETNQLIRQLTDLLMVGKSRIFFGIKKRPIVKWNVF